MNGSPGKKDQLQFLGKELSGVQIDDPSYDSFAVKKYGEEAKLLEQDPFMLEEQRYLDRLKLSQLKQNLNYDNMNQKFTIPQQVNYEKKMKLE